ncbi:MAG: hypothetical protein Q9159_004565 [Coniocarpon cinnabarinum]
MEQGPVQFGDEEKAVEVINQPYDTGEDWQTGWLMDDGSIDDVSPPRSPITSTYTLREDELNVPGTIYIICSNGGNVSPRSPDAQVISARGSKSLTNITLTTAVSLNARATTSTQRVREVFQEIQLGPGKVESGNDISLEKIQHFLDEFNASTYKRGPTPLQHQAITLTSTWRHNSILDILTAINSR